MRTPTRFLQFACLLSAVSVIGCKVPKFSATKDFEQTIPVVGELDVVASTFNGGITVTPSDGTEVAIVAHIKAYGMTQEEADEAIESLEPSIDASKSKVTIQCKKRSGRMFFSDSVSLELKVPRKSPVDLTTSNGRVSVRETFGPAQIATSNGTIEVEETAGDLHVSTSNGRIKIENVSGKIEASTSNGAIQMKSCTLEGACSLRTSNGAVEVDLVRQPDLNIDASTSNGSIRCDIEASKLSTKSRNRVFGVLFAESNDETRGSTSLEIGTSNGRITIERAKDKPTKEKPSPSNGKDNEDSPTFLIPVENS